MAYIKRGDLIVTHSGLKYIAVSDDRTEIVHGSGEYVNDYRARGVVDVVVPETGAEGKLFMGDVKEVIRS